MTATIKELDEQCRLRNKSVTFMWHGKAFHYNTDDEYYVGQNLLSLK